MEVCLGQHQFSFLCAGQIVLCSDFRFAHFCEVVSVTVAYAFRFAAAAAISDSARVKHLFIRVWMI